MASMEIEGLEGARVIDVRYDVHIDAPIEKVFAGLTDEAGQWWSHSSVDKARDVVLEPRVGGRFFEDWGDGEGWLYATVTRIKRPELIALVGGFGMVRATNFITYDLEPEDGGTRVRLTHYGFGDVDAETRAGYEAGWKQLLDKDFREFLKTGRGKGPRSRR